MASRRCGCASDSCACVVAGGAGIEVSGSGTRTNPYVLDSTTDPFALADAKGDLLVASAPDLLDRLAVGTNGQVLTADSTQPTGVKWGAAAVAPVVPTLIATTAYAVSGSTTQAITVPAGTLAGDLLVVLAAGSAAFISASGGNATNWVTLPVAGASNGNGGMAVGIAGATSAGATVTVLWTGSTNDATLMVVRNWKQMVAWSGFGTNTPATITQTPLLLPSPNCLVLTKFGFRNNTATITSTFGTQQSSGNNGANWASKAYSGVGAYGMVGVFATSSASAENCAFALALAG